MMETIVSQPAGAAAAAVRIIKGVVGADAIWCFGRRVRSEDRGVSFLRREENCRAEHLYLLVFAAGALPGLAEEINDRLSQESSGKAKATVLLYDTRRLSRIKGNHRYFLSEAVAGAECLFAAKGYAIPEFGNDGYDPHARLQYWNHCKYMATCCLEAETAIENPNAEPVQAVLLRQAAEQVCLGLIYGFMGCRPNWFELGYLLDLCALFFPEADTLFPRTSPEEQARFAHLSLRMESLRYRLAHPGITDIEVLRSRVHRFLSAAGEAVGQEAGAAVRSA